jgi:hypothetical protein
VIVVVQLVLSLSTHTLDPLTGVSLLGCPHRQVVRSGRLHRGPREHPLDLGLGTRRAGDFRGDRLAENQLLEPVPTRLAGVFVDRYDVTLGPKGTIAVSSSMLHRYDVTVPQSGSRGKRNKNGPSRVYRVHVTHRTTDILAGGMIKDGHP